MSYIVVKTFETEAGEKSAHKFLADSNLIDLNDSALVVRDADGKVHIKNETYLGRNIGLVGGGVLGALVGGIVFPFVGILTGSVVGGLLGRFASHPIDRSFVKDISENIPPGSSALFVIVRGDTPDDAIEAMKDYKGKLHYTSMPDESEAALRSALSSLGNELEE